MGNKRDVKIILVPLLIFLVFLLSIIGYKQLLGNSFTLSGVIYSTLFFFILNNIDPIDATSNIYILIARYLAAVMLGLGIYRLLYKYISYQFRRLKIKYGYRNHVVIFSIRTVGSDFLTDLLANNYKVLLADESAEGPDYEKAKREGVIVFKDERGQTKLFDTMQVVHSSACIIATGNDSRNIELALKLIGYLRRKAHKRTVRVLLHIQEQNNLEVIKDYIDTSNEGENFELEIFNIFSSAAKKIYDHFPPHSYFNFSNPDDDHAIAVVGYNTAAEDFIIENMILSHYQDGRNIKIYLVDRDADHHLNQFMYQYPFSREFVDIVPVKLLNNKFFANFNWSKELIEKLSKVKAAYFFGNEGSELINIAARFRQFLSGQVHNYLAAPVIICFPEDTDILKLINVERENTEHLSGIFKKELNINFVNMVADTCTSSRLLEESEYIDLLSRVINYYYSIKHEFGVLLKDKFGVNDPTALVRSIDDKLLALPDNGVGYLEREVEQLVLQSISAHTKKAIGELQLVFGIKKRWNQLSYHKKSSNRYAARHFAIKIAIMKNIGCLPLTRENILHSFPVIAPVEHKRWSAEKMMLNYRFGPLPADSIAKKRAKELLKIHDQLIPYEKLSDAEKEKDLNIFMLMPY